jgi:hypothetical protein
MKAFKSNTNTEGCSPISSNCVIWQGPDLPCLNLCKGDTVSDVVYKLAEEVCDLKDSIGLSNVDLACLLKVCQTTPEPAKTLNNILQLLVNKVCCLSDIIKALPPPGNNYQEPILNLPTCLQYPDGTGGTVTKLIHNQYTLRIATVLCALQTTVTNQGGQISSLDVRVTALENKVPVVPQISSCLLGTLANVEVVVEELEDQFCLYKTALGPLSDINIVPSRQCANLNTQMQLATGFPMTSLVGWKSSVTNLAQSLNNLWLTVCDIRGAVKIIQDTCCKVDCDDIIIDFDYRWIDAVTLRIFFTPKSTLPAGFYDCNQTFGNKITITDGNGSSWNTYFFFRNSNPLNLTGLLDDINIITNGYDLDFSLSPLDTSTVLKFDSNLCFTNGTTQCIKCFDKEVDAYINTDCCTITASATVTIVYQTCFIPTSTSTTQ